MITYLWPPLSLYRLFGPHGLVLHFDVPISSLKDTCLFLYLTFKPILVCTHDFWPQTRVHRDVCINPDTFGFFFIWVWTNWLLAFHMPWYHSYSTLDYLFGVLYKEIYGTLKAYERIESKETIVHCCRNLCLSLHPFVPWSTFVFFPSFPFACELAIERWRIEVVEAQVGDSVSPVRRRSIRGCIYCNLWFILIEISFPVQ